MNTSRGNGYPVKLYVCTVSYTHLYKYEDRSEGIQ
ncbi:hypothetical protein A5875_003387 [Enterococcus sp. 3H8_DIV0648]|nr:hypothetical protein A5875_003387 [Enterococcus sp. 3H8_DIV0648]